MKLATILTGILLVMALAIVGCDGGDDDGGGGQDTIIGSDDTPVGDDDTTAPGDDTIIDPACEAACAVDKCGMVGDCDCGSCNAGFTCVAATNTCAPDVVDCEAVCTGKECGIFQDCPCGDCGEGDACNDTTGVCEPVTEPDCTGKQCGPDGLGGSCGLCPCVGCDPTATMCNDATGMCEAAAALDCVGINDCLSECNPNDQDCIQDCMNQGSPEAQGQYNAIIQCLIDNGAQQCPPGDAQCQNDIIAEHCMDEYGTCFPAGTMDCQEMYDCIQACTTDTCPNECAANSTLDAVNKYNAIVTCVIEQCGEQPDQECFQAAQQGVCSLVFADCFNLG